jgi:hypothetical protein
MIPVFDYGNINKDHKDAAEEIANYLTELGQPMFAELIKQKFKVVERPKYNLEESPFIQSCRKAGIYCAIQGYTLDNNIEYPLVTVCEDIRKLNNLHSIINESNGS